MSIQPITVVECVDFATRKVYMRLNFEFTEDQVKELKELQRKTGSTSMKDLFNSAMSVFEWAVDETIKGNEIASLNEEDKNYRILMTPSLQRAAKLHPLAKVS